MEKEAEMMKWPPSSTDEVEIQIVRESTTTTPCSSSYARSGDDNIISSNSFVIGKKLVGELRTIACPSCSHHIPLIHQGGILNDLPGMPAGVKFDPTDVEILEHLEAKAKSDTRKLHPLIDEFIQTVEGDNGICYTHPENLPGVSKDGQIRHFFHRPSKAYTTGTRKRRKVHNDEYDGSGSSGETRWHKTGKTRAVIANGIVKGFKKILVLYTNYGRQKKPEKTNWVMHQYHHGHSEEEKEGELVLSKVFYQTQSRQSVHPQPTFKEPILEYLKHDQLQQQLVLQQVGSSSTHVVEYYHQQPQLISFGDHDQSVDRRESNVVPQSKPNSGVQLGDDDDGSSFACLDGRNKQKERFE